MAIAFAAVLAALFLLLCYFLWLFASASPDRLFKSVTVCQHLLANLLCICEPMVHMNLLTRSVHKKEPHPAWTPF